MVLHVCAKEYSSEYIPVLDRERSLKALLWFSIRLRNASYLEVAYHEISKQKQQSIIRMSI